MNIKRIVPLVLTLVVLITITTVQAAEENFSVSSLEAKDVDCKKCHTDTPHIIHAQKATATCENCHGDKLSVDIPQCTKCHDGPIHKVHVGKIEKGCDYCHKTVVQIHTNLTSDAVCSHCHKDLVEVHGQSESCTKCHRTPPEIVKPLKLEGMILVCQNCHPATSIATIHGNETYKQGCYNCHKGVSELSGSDIPHQIHKDKASCKDCHEENGKVVVPQCKTCHKIDELHSFNKIGKLTAQSGLSCPICHAEISEQKVDITDTPIKIDTEVKEKQVLQTQEKQVLQTQEKQVLQTQEKQEEKDSSKIPGFEIMSGILILYIVTRRINDEKR